MAKIKGSPKLYGNGNQYSAIQQTGDGAYPPLEIRRDSAPTLYLARYIFLQSYSESYKADWDFSDTNPGDINLKPEYTLTKRTIEMSFTLAARNVHEAKKNLDFCQKLARTVYRDYANMSDDAKAAREEGEVALSNPEFAATATPEWVVNFGTFLREQTVKMLSFDFEINFDAGVFDYGSTPTRGAGTVIASAELNVGGVSDAAWASGNNQPSDMIKEDSYVYHGDKGGVYPKLVSVKISMLPDEHTTIGFGGFFRAENSLGWSLSAKGAPRNALLDWPHGTGPIPAAEYCQRTPNDGSGRNVYDTPLDPDNEQIQDGDEPTAAETAAFEEAHRGFIE